MQKPSPIYRIGLDLCKLQIATEKQADIFGVIVFRKYCFDVIMTLASNAFYIFNLNPF